MSLMSMGAFAQQMFVKPMVGGTLATITGDYTDDCKMKLGLAAGAEFGYMIAPQFAVTAGALVSMQGTGIKDNDRTTDYSTTLTYLNIPILANYYIILVYSQDSCSRKRRNIRGTATSMRTQRRTA